MLILLEFVASLQVSDARGRHAPRDGGGCEFGGMAFAGHECEGFKHSFEPLCGDDWVDERKSLSGSRSGIHILRRPSKKPA
jgi:hypothetical protein